MTDQDTDREQIEKPVPQVKGWVCFYCDEAFDTYKAAEEHFGAPSCDPDDDHNPGCVERLNYTEKALRAGLMQMYLEWCKDRDENIHLQSELDHWRNVDVSIRKELERYFGGRATPYEAWQQYDFVKNQADTYGQILDRIRETHPNVLAAAEDWVCTPPEKRIG